jgi:type IV pilus assembly protein PilY1
MISNVSVADDTEIYGATAIDEDSRVNSNVLFIMDTSGSMRGTVTSTHAVYDPATDYSGDYDSYPTDIYHDLYSSRKQGHKYSSLDGSSCATEINTLTTVGKVQGNFKQSNKNTLKNGSDKTISCGSGGVYILHTSNYMNWFHSGGRVSSTRMEVVVDVVKELTNTLTNINLGLMRFDGNSDGGMIDVPISDISISGPLIQSKLDSYYPDGGTPLEETMYEAARYYRGEEWYFGNDSWPNSSVSDSRQGVASTTYKSPIEESCQKNHIILLTDGEPSWDTNANSRVRSLVASATLPASLNKSCSGNGECLDELAYWLKNNDHSTTQAGSQPITTYTIGGFGLANGVALLKNTADFGGGRYFAADDTAELTEALESIFLDILSTDSTFTAPAVSVNAFNASEHRDDLFYALFRPAENVKWAGNLKKYRLTEDGIVEGSEVGVPAISDATGFFNEGVSDIWNDTGIPDGKKIDEGGAANILPDPESRNIWTNTATARQMVDFKSGASATSFDVPNDDFENTYNWSIGIDIDNSILDEDSDEFNVVNRDAIGDPLHSEPVIVTYGAIGGDTDKPDSTIFFGTNEGFIHAINTDTGVEEFAFIPRDLHKTQKIYFNNNSPVADKPYGMDGKITSWFQDKNQNSILDLSDNERIYLYSGMRRGGRNYYGLDVSDRDKPGMLFEILGGTVDGEFEELGQTWSGMTVARVFIKDPSGSGKIEKDVLIFGGGYDENQDLDSPALGSDEMGRAIYIVDAESGDLLAWIGGEHSKGSKAKDLTIDEMKNSIPASVSAIDITGDGVVDYLFAVDTGGKVFRVDLHYDDGLKFTGGMIANLGSSVADADLTKDNRRFYNKPNVALVKDKQEGDYLTIAVGSGHRAHPILTTAVENRFYVLKDKNVATVSPSYKYTSLLEADPSINSLGDKLEDIVAAKTKVFNASPLMNGDFDPSTDAGKVSTSNMKKMLTAAGGWYITFSTEGEKVLAESTTFSGAIIFTTFSKSGIASTTCGPDTGMSRVYVLDQKWAEPAIDLNGDGKIDEDDSSKILSHSGIAPRPVVIYRKGGKKTIAIGTEAIEDTRFQQDAASAEDCTTDCEKVVSECEGSNCSVTPIYWHE